MVKKYKRAVFQTIALIVIIMSIVSCFILINASTMPSGRKTILGSGISPDINVGSGSGGGGSGNPAGGGSGGSSGGSSSSGSSGGSSGGGSGGGGGGGGSSSLRKINVSENITKTNSTAGNLTNSSSGNLNSTLQNPNNSMNINNLNNSKDDLSQVTGAAIKIENKGGLYKWLIPAIIIVAVWFLASLYYNKTKRKR